MSTDTSTKKPPRRKSIVMSERKQLILDFIHEYRRKREVSPTYLEIAKGIGFADNAEGTAHTYVNELITEGWLRKAQAGSRSILPVYPVNAIYCEITDPELISIKKRQRDLRILRRL